MAHLFTGAAMFFEDGTFDCAGRRAIHLGAWLLVGALALPGCKDEPPPPADAGALVPPPPAEEPVPLDAGEAGEDAAPTEDGQAPDAGQVAAEEPRLKAVGRAPKGADIGLARDLAASVARRNLLKKMKELGSMPPDARDLQGASIDRYWIQGRWVHAEASIPVGQEPASVNVPAEAPSKPANQGQPPDAATAEGENR